MSDLNLDLDNIELENLIISAVRYAIGRRTYIVSETANIVGRNVDKLSERCLCVLRNDLERAIALDDLGDENVDRPIWLHCYDIICERCKECNIV